MKYYIDFNENQEPIGFLSTNEVNIENELVEVTKEDFKRYFEACGNIFIDPETVVIKPNKTELEILHERILQLEVAEVNRKSMEIEKNY